MVPTEEAKMTLGMLYSACCIAFAPLAMRPPVKCDGWSSLANGSSASGFAEHTLATISSFLRIPPGGPSRRGGVRGISDGRAVKIRRSYTGQGGLSRKDLAGEGEEIEEDKEVEAIVEAGQGWAVERNHDKRLRLDIHIAIYLFVAGAVGGAINAVAGGGSFISFPALLFSGVAPIPANATNTLALWGGTAASGSAYKNRLKLAPRGRVPRVTTSVLGGVAG